MNSVEYSETKLIADNLERLDIRELKKAGLLSGRKSANITFKDGLIINLTAHISPVHDCSLHLSFPQQIGFGSTHLVVELDKCPCRFGGFRLWFLCPHCRKRVGILYKVKDIFACRHCHNIIYQSQLSGKSQLYSVHKWNKLRCKILELIPKTKRKVYAGQATRNNIKLANLIRQYDCLKGGVFLLLEKMQAREAKLRSENRYY